MSLARFDDLSQRALALAHAAAGRAAAAVEPLDLVAGLLRLDAAGLAAPLVLLNRDAAAIADALARPSGPSRPPPAILDPSPDLQSFLDRAWDAAAAQQRHIVSLHALAAAVAQHAAAVPALGERLAAAGLTPDDLKRAIASAFAPTESAATPKPARNLAKFARCLTDLARAGTLDPTIGRDAEIHRLMQVLCRRVKNNPVLLGKPGVGKTAIVHGLAQRIATGDVPAPLKRASIYSMDFGSLLAGGEFRGVVEDRLKRALDDIREAGGDVILFIDEIHTIAQGSSADLATILKPALATGELRCIGVTTPDEYRTHIEKDGALERRFQPVQVHEPSVDDTVHILRGLRSRYEAFHDVHITDDALAAAAVLSHRFISDRSLPDKAIDLMDEAASRLRLERDTLPVELQAAQKQAAQRAAELAASDSPHARHTLRLEAAHLADASRRDRTLWDEQRALGHDVLAQRRRLEWRRLLARHDASPQPSAGLVRAIASAEPILAAAEARLTALCRERRLFKTDLEAEDIAQVVASWTGIPVSKLLENERAKLLTMEDSLHLRVVGQDRAIRAVSNAVRLARAGMKDPNRPVGSFLFLGPTGVGKTELSRALAELLFDDESAMIRIDMSEYMDKHTVSRLVGAPPGYIGYDESGQLTEAVRRRPYAVVLFDEIEKAHPDVFNILLQVMDDGRLSDGHGRTVDFKNTILIMTSNVGGRLYRESIGKSKAVLIKRINDELRKHFRPEFLNRIDAIVHFDALERPQIAEIVEIQMRLANRRLAGGGLRLEVAAPVKAWLARAGYDPLQGARPLKRLIQQQILEPLALRVLKGEYEEGDVYTVAMKPGKAGALTFKRRRAAPPPPATTTPRR
ncbi:MAG: AAA family ATPase [Dehalococcoidia bacterium]|nr:AAA family ATPase [Dehalococcoidia bacterium]